MTARKKAFLVVVALLLAVSGPIALYRVLSTPPLLVVPARGGEKIGAGLSTARDTAGYAADGSHSGFMTSAQYTKLAGITAGANTLSSLGSTDNAVCRADGTGGHTVQGSNVSIDDTGNVSVPALATVDGRDLSVDGTKLDGITAGANTLSSYGSTDNAVLRADGTGTHTGQGSLVTIDDSGNVSMAALATVDGRDVSVDGTKLDTITTGANTLGTLGATDNVVPRSDGTGAHTLQSSSLVIDDTGLASGITFADPSAAQDPATRAYVDAAGFTVMARTTAALPANTYNNGTSGVGATMTANANGAFPTLDGTVTLSVGDRFYAVNEATASHNGVYTLTAAGSGSTPWIATRSTRADTAAEIIGSKFRVLKGIIGNGAEYVFVSEDFATVGTDALFYRRIDPRLPAVEGFRYFDDLTYISVFGTANTTFSLGYLTILNLGTTATCVSNPSGVNDANTRGVASCSTGSVNNSIVGVTGGWTVAATQPDGGDCFIPSANVGFDYAVRVTAPTLSDSAQEYEIEIGIAKQRAQGQHTPADFVGWVYDRSATSPVTTTGNMNLHWVAIAGSGGTYTNTVTDSGVTVTAGTYDVLRITKYAGSANIRFRVNEALTATYSTNISTTTCMSTLAAAFKSVGTSSINAIRIDKVSFELNTPTLTDAG